MLEKARVAAIADGLVAFLGPTVEAIVHDIVLDQIVHISNPLSRRIVGDPSDMASVDFTGRDIVGPYEKTNWDGRRLRSLSIVLRGRAGDPIGLRCLNSDMSALEDLRLMLDRVLGGDRDRDPLAVAMRDDWHERLSQTIAKWLADHDAAIDRLSRPQRRKLVADLAAGAAFERRKSVEYVARLLGISRATIYKELSFCRGTPAG